VKHLLAAASFSVATLAALYGARACEVAAAPALAARMTAWLAAHPAEEANCLMLVVVSEAEAETLVLTTRDGRVARRSIEAESELEETIDALLLAPPPPPRPALPPAPPSLPPPVPAPIPAAAPTSAHHLFAATGPVWHPEPGIGLFAIETGWSWQPASATVEVGARWAPLTMPGGTPMAGFSASASDLWAAAGLPLLRRSHLRLDAALRAGWQTFAETADNPVTTKKNDLELTGDQWLTGAQLVAHHAVARHLALRAALETNLALTGLRAKGATSKGLPPLPGFGVALLLGLEAAP